ncbi:MAG: hypothetical protein ACKVHP_20090, partial [Verrucomicrobiales bacterium]
MMNLTFPFISGFSLLTMMSLVAQEPFEISVRPLTSGPQSHFFGYIGHVGNIPWNGNGRYLV